MLRAGSRVSRNDRPIGDLIGNTDQTRRGSIWNVNRETRGAKCRREATRLAKSVGSQLLYSIPIANESVVL